MNYETAKQLKDAGFRQKGDGRIIYPKGFNGARSKMAYAPTLEELIEACGDDVGIFKISATECNAWKKNYPTADPDEVPAFFTGATPTEAVAKLWLALNKKV